MTTNLLENYHLIYFYNYLQPHEWLCKLPMTKRHFSLNIDIIWNFRNEKSKLKKDRINNKNVRKKLSIEWRKNTRMYYPHDHVYYSYILWMGSVFCSYTYDGSRFYTGSHMLASSLRSSKKLAAVYILLWYHLLLWRCDVTAMQFLLCRKLFIYRRRKRDNGR